MTREDILEFIVENRKMYILREGETPYWLYVFGDKSKEWEANTYTISAWCSMNPIMVEIKIVNDGNCMFSGFIYTIEDFKRVLYLIFDCYNTENERPENEIYI